MKKVEKNANSYVKVIAWMVLGGVFGAAIGAGSVFFGKNTQGAVQSMTVWVQGNTILLLGILAIVSLLLTIFCYRKSEQMICVSEQNEDDVFQDEIDEKFDFWGNIGFTVTSVAIYLAIAIFAFQSYGDMGNVEGVLVTCGLLLFIVIVCVFYQVAAVKQIRRKEPLKQGDAADMNFEKVWLNSCDEGEKQVIYEAAYKAFSMTRTFLLVATLIALLGDSFLGGGLTAVVLLTACNVVMTVTYAYFSVKLGKGKRTA